MVRGRPGRYLILRSGRVQHLAALLVHDPFVEIATRLTWLQARAPDAANPIMQWRVGTLAEAADFVAGFDLDDPKGLKRLFEALPDGAYRLLYNPFTRQCGTKIPGDRHFPGYSLNAIEVLSQVDVIEHRRLFDALAATLFDQVGIHVAVPALEPDPETVLALADCQITVKLAQEMLVFDFAMSDAVLNAVFKAWTDT